MDDKALKTNRFTGPVDGSGNGNQSPMSGRQHKEQPYAVSKFNQAWKNGKPKDVIYKGGNGMGGK